MVLDGCGYLLRGGGLFAVVLGVGVLTGLGLRPTVATSWSHLGSLGLSTSPDRLLVAGIVVLATGVLGAVWLWALVAVVLCLTEAAWLSPPSTGRAARSSEGSAGRSSMLRPRVVRLLVAVAMGSTVGSLVTGPVAHGAEPADQPGGPESAHRSDGAATLPPGLRGLRLPDRVLGTGSHARASAQPPRFHTVKDGESLWAIADRLLAAKASYSEVDQAWRRIYRSNRPVIGPNPDLIHPGERLRLPPLPGSSPRTGGTP